MSTAGSESPFLQHPIETVQNCQGVLDCLSGRMPEGHPAVVYYGHEFRQWLGMLRHAASDVYPHLEPAVEAQMPGAVLAVRYAKLRGGYMAALAQFQILTCIHQLLLTVLSLPDDFVPCMSLIGNQQGTMTALTEAAERNPLPAGLIPEVQAEGGTQSTVEAFIAGLTSDVSDLGNLFALLRQGAVSADAAHDQFARAINIVVAFAQGLIDALGNIDDGGIDQGLLAQAQACLPPVEELLASADVLNNWASGLAIACQFSDDFSDLAVALERLARAR